MYATHSSDLNSYTFCSI